MIGRRKKTRPVQRAPHLAQQKQAVFQYSSNRSHSERPRPRGEAADSDGEEVVSKSPHKTSFAIVGIIVVIAAVFLSLLPGAPKVVFKEGSHPLRDNAGYSQAAADIVADDLLNRTKLTLNRQAVAVELQSRYPELTNVHVSTPLLARGAVITAQSSQPVALLRTGDAEYLIDNRGIALFDLKKTRATTEMSGVLALNDSSDTALKIGQAALTSVQTAYLMELGHQSAAAKLKIDSVELAAGGGELYVRFADLPYYVKFNIYENVRKSFGTFMAAKEAAGKGKVAQAVEYIDVRIPERAYIK